MKNLAGDVDCDREIRRELTRARIDIVKGERSTHEVAASLTGKLGPFTFQRAWYYWVAKGPTPLDAARELFADPVGKTDVRVAGHCGCPPPEHPWVEYYDADGKRVALDPGGKEREQYRRLVERGHLELEGLAAYHWVDSPEERDAVSVRAVVESYHIDTEAGLRLFVDTLRKHGLDREAGNR